MLPISGIFLGVHWSLESSEGFDEYLKAKGTPWIIRKAIAATPHTITWDYLDTHRWLVHHKGLFKSVKCGFHMEEEFLAKRFDGQYYNIEIYAGLYSVTERYRKKIDKEEPEEVYTYYIEDEKLEMERDGITCRRIYKWWRPKHGMDHTRPQMIIGGVPSSIMSVYHPEIV